MRRYQKDLAEMGKIPKDVMFKIIELVDEDIVTQQEIAGLKDVLEDIDVDIDRVEAVFYNIVMAKDHTEEFTRLIDDTNELTTNQKCILKDTMKRIHDKVDIRKIKINYNISYLKTFGHMYAQIDDFSITTEFRPYSDNDTKKIIKIVPSLVIDTALYDSRNKSKPINLQMNLDDAQLLVDTLNRKIDTLKAEVQEMREKFGKDVI